MEQSPVNMAAFNDAQDQKVSNLKDRFAKAAATGDQKSLEKAAQQFESYMMSNMFKTMYSGVEKSEMSGNTMAQDTFMGMFIDECTKKGNLGCQGVAAQIMKKYSAQKTVSPAETLSVLQNTAANPAAPLSPSIVALASDNPELPSRSDVVQSLLAMTDGLENHMSSDYGMRVHPIEHIKKFHAGMDYALPYGDEVQAPAAGTVSFAGNDGGYGKTVIVDHGHGLQTVYAHLSEVDVKTGEYINKSEPLGKIGSTGISTGPHLHFEVRENNKPIDPKRLESSDQKIAKE